MTPSLKVDLDFYGITVRVHAEDSKFIDWIKFDFHYFVNPINSTPRINITVRIGNPASLIPPLIESNRSPKYVIYDQSPRRYVDYFGRAVVIHNQIDESADITSLDVPFAYEKLYLFILSRVGEMLDRQGLHRVHALGFEINQKGALVLLPERGGKSTLALDLLKDARVSIFSEDTPLIDRKGHLYPFPLRFGMRERENLGNIPSDYLRELTREEGGAKHLVHINYFKDQIARRPGKVDFLFIGKWTRHHEPSLESVSAWKAIRSLFRDCVFGLGLPQVVEFFLRNGWGGIQSKSGIFLKRTIASVFLSLKTKNFYFYLSPDKEKNIYCLLSALEKAGSK